MRTINFTHKKKVIALDELKKMLECGEKAGIRQAMFVGFGCMLGQIMLFDKNKGHGDFIPHDDDMDMCIDADMITPEQEAEYYRQLVKNGLFSGGRHKVSFKSDANGFDSSIIQERHGRVEPTGKKVRFAWLSLKHMHGGVKSCNWFFFKWNGFYWHTKGGKWVNTTKFNKYDVPFVPTDDAIMKGIPQDYLGEYVDTPFHNITVPFPAKIGHCADFWYPGWSINKGGKSSKEVLCVVRRWEDQKTWKVITR